MGGGGGGSGVGEGVFKNYPKSRFLEKYRKNLMDLKKENYEILINFPYKNLKFQKHIRNLETIFIKLQENFLKTLKKKLIKLTENQDEILF